MSAGRNRREFLVEVGRGMLLAGVGATVAEELGLATLRAAEEGGSASERLTFGELEPMVAWLQETPPEKLIPQAVERLRAGTTLEQLVSAAALANARAFGGEDYIGFHTLMALEPALRMTESMPSSLRALPVLKVLYRNSARIQEHGPANETLHLVDSSAVNSGGDPAIAMRDAVHRQDVVSAEQTLAGYCSRSTDSAFNSLLSIVEEAPEVHRVVLVHRAWDMVSLVGLQHAQTMLRQSLRYCVKNEEWAAKNFSSVRTLLPRLLEEHKLLSTSRGDRKLDDASVASLADQLFKASHEDAAGIAASALADGLSPDAILEAVALAANQLVLRDEGRAGNQIQKGKPAGSVHGDSIGVHACDSANAWRHIARVSDDRNSAAAVILSAYQMALDRVQRGGDFQNWAPRPHADQLEKVTEREPDALLSRLDAAIREQNQAAACAIVHRFGELHDNPQPIVQALCGFAASEDGALHAEKYFRTTTNEFELSRPAFRWRQLVALARVTASEFGTPAPGRDETLRLLGNV